MKSRGESRATARMSVRQDHASITQIIFRQNQMEAIFLTAFCHGNPFVHEGLSELGTYMRRNSCTMRTHQLICPTSDIRRG